jgi:hypothetical protein
MKNYTIYLIPILLILVFFILDRELYFFGKNSFPIYKSLPFEIEPEFRDRIEGGFCLRDEFGFALISKGECQFVGDKNILVIDKIIKYGYAKQNLVVLISDTNNFNYYIEFFKKNENEQKIHAKVTKDTSYSSKIVYKWVFLENKRIDIIYKLQIFIKLILFFYLMLIFVNFVKGINRKASKV